MELYGLLPNGKPINTNPYLKDTDGDGIPDNEEIHFSLENLTCEVDKSEYDNSIIAWSDPTSTTVKNKFGQIVFKGELYEIDVPTIRNRQDQYWYEPVYKEVEHFTPESKIDFKLLTYISGKENSMSDDPYHDGTEKIDLYTFTNNGYLKEEFKTKESYQYIVNGFGAICGITELINGTVTNKSVSFTFYKTEKNEARKVIVVASSTDVERAYAPYANDISTSAYFCNSGNVTAQIYISKAAQEIYTDVTGYSTEKSDFYDFMITVDKRHANNGIFAQLWINNNGDVMAVPLLYTNDKVEIGRRYGFLYYDYIPLIELKLSDSINLEQDFVNMFNQIYN